MMSYFFRGVVFTLGCLSTLVVIGGIAHAASGGLFGDILAKMLGINVADITTYSGDGTVANSQKLGGFDASDFQKIAPGQSCGAWRCIYGIDPSGNIRCR